MSAMIVDTVLSVALCLFALAGFVANATVVVVLVASKQAK